MPDKKKKEEDNRMELIEAEEMVEKLAKDLDSSRRNRNNSRNRSGSRNRSSSSARASRMDICQPDDAKEHRDRSGSSRHSLRASRMDLSQKEERKDRSNSSVRQSHSDTDQLSLGRKSRSNSRGDASPVKGPNSETSHSAVIGKPCLKKPSRSKSDTRIKEVAYTSLSEAKTKLKEQAKKADAKVGGISNLVSKAADMVEDSRLAIRAFKPFLDSDDESVAGAVGGVGVEDVRFDDDQWQMDEDPHGLGDLTGEFQKMILEDIGKKDRKRSLNDQDDEYESLPPRKITSPDRPLSAISERRPDSSCPSDDEAFANDIFDVVDQRDIKIEWLQDLCREKDAEISKVKKENAEIMVMIEERDEELSDLNAKEKENEKTILRLRRELSEARTSLNDEKVNGQAQQQQHEEEHDIQKAKYEDLWAKVSRLKDDLLESKKDREKLTEMLMASKKERRKEKEERQKVDDSHRLALNEMSKRIDSLKEENRRERKKRADVQSTSEDKYRKLKKSLLEKKEGYKKTGVQDMKDVFAVDGSASDTDSDSDEDAEDEDRRIENKKALKHHELKAMSDSFLVWPKYEECYDHSNFVDKCEKAAKRAIHRGLPKDYVATSLNVFVEKKVPRCREKFEILKGDDTTDLSLRKTLELLRLSDPGHHASGVEKFLSITQAKREEEESFMKRVERRHDKHLIAANEAERIRAIKKQFYNGLIWKPPGLEAAMATCMDLDVVAQTTRQMIEDSRGQRSRNNTSEDSRYLRLPSTRPRYRPSVAAVSDGDDEEDFDEDPIERKRGNSSSPARKDSAAVVEKTDEETKKAQPERAETGREFRNDVIVCRRCRYIGLHYTNQCVNRPYCSHCQREGHSDEGHLPANQWRGQNRAPYQRPQSGRSNQQDRQQGNWQERQQGNWQERPQGGQTQQGGGQRSNYPQRSNGQRR